MKITYIVSLSVTLFGAIGIYLFESNILEPYFVGSLGVAPSNYPPKSHEDHEYYMSKVIPFFSLLAKLGTNLTLYTTFQASFSDPRIFPNIKRTTAIGICNFVSFFITIFAPLIAELNRPIPILIIIVVSEIALLVSFTFKSEKEDQFDSDKILRQNDMTLEHMMS